MPDITVVLYTKANCTLCDVVKKQLAELQRSLPHSLREVDITGDSATFATYRYRIPVVDVNGDVLEAPIAREDLEVALRTAAGHE